MKKRTPESPPRGRPGRNAPCWCGSEIKFKRCHLEDDKKPLPPAPNGAPVAPLAVGEAALLQTLRSQPSQVLDPRGLFQTIEMSPNPIFIVDEQQDDGVLVHSVVALPGKLAHPAGDAIVRALADTPKKVRLKMSSQRLLRLRPRGSDRLLAELQHYLNQAQVVRVGSSYESIRAWKKQARFALKMATGGPDLTNPQFLVILKTLSEMAFTLGLKGVVNVFVDSSAYNGLDPSERRAEPGTLRSLGIEVPELDGLVFHIVATWKQEPTFGRWVWLADLDAARMVSEPEYKSFVAGLRNHQGVGTTRTWGRAFPRFPPRFPKFSFQSSIPTVIPHRD